VLLDKLLDLLEREPVEGSSPEDPVAQIASAFSIQIAAIEVGRKVTRRIWFPSQANAKEPAIPVRISVSSSLLAATMNQKASLREDPQFVSQVLTGNTWFIVNWFLG
jgi:hypothetical protein